MCLTIKIMLLKLEIEQFCLDIEKKAETLEGKAREKALEKIAVLNRVNLEFMEYEDLLRTVALKNNDLSCNYLKQKIQIRDLESKINYLESELKTVKENIK